MFSQSSVVGGVGSGAGAYGYGAAVNQTGNLLNTDTHIEGPRILVGTTNHPGGARKKRFGVTGSASIFDYPDLAIKSSGGNGQAYKQSEGGYLPGNNGGGQAGYGARDPHDFTFKEAADLTMAKEIAQRDANHFGNFVQPEHMAYKDRTAESMQERFTDMAMDYQRQRIKDLLAKGFSEEEIKTMLSKEREKAILQAERQPYSKEALMKAQIAQMLPTEQREDFPNTSVAPGGIARRQDATSIERALNTGNTVAMRKKMEAVRREQRLQGQLSYVEPSVVQRVLPQQDVTNLMMRLAQKEHGEAEKHDNSLEEAHQRQQHSMKRQLDLQKAGMLAAISKRQ